jgi:uncharacterized membrane protein
MTLYQTVVTLHVLAALFWLGGMFFLAAVGAPVLREIDSAELRRALFTRLGRRFRAAGWAAIATLLATGLWTLHLRGVLTMEVLTASTFWRTPFGTALAWKLGLVATMLALQAVHDFVDGPRAGRADPRGAQAARLRRRAAWLARVNALLGLALVYVAVRLARGG